MPHRIFQLFIFFNLWIPACEFLSLFYSHIDGKASQYFHTYSSCCFKDFLSTFVDIACIVDLLYAFLHSKHNLLKPDWD